MNDYNNHELPDRSPLGDLGADLANSSDFAEILEIQKDAFLSEAKFYQNFNIQPITQTLSEMKEECKEKVVLKATIKGKIVGSIRANSYEIGCWVNKLVVLPEYQRQGIGEKLLRKIETYFPDAEKFTLGTGADSKSNIRLYQKVGYQIIGKSTFDEGVEVVIMEKKITPKSPNGEFKNYMNQ